MNAAQWIVAVISAAVIAAPFVAGVMVTKKGDREYAPLFYGVGVVAVFWIGLTAWSLIKALGQ
jgi:hypothetical protein